ncbi:hypothetical protein ACIQ9K_27045 [Streptomyces microflavus]|uniref:hypothetical protein n=1 Tax=Streptomyces microflavus TaxID=1919 RepID=UPI0037F1E003
MQTDLSKLTTAAGKWEIMASEFKKLEDQYERTVHGAAADASWAGLSAAAAKEHFNVTLREFRGAQKEAKAIAALLRDAHTQFVALKKKVESARADAIKAGMKVSDRGVVSFDFSRVSAQHANTIRHDPDLQSTEQSWTQYIQQAVSMLDDADRGVKIALGAVTVDSNITDGTLDGFNREAKMDVEEYEAENAKEIATRLNSGEKVSAAELAELQRAFRDNARPGLEDRVFSQTFLNGLGVTGTVKLSTKLDALAYLDDKGNKAAYLGIKNGFADTLAHATKDPQFAAKWRDDIKAVGTKEFDGPRGEGVPVKGSEGKVRGYQAVMGLVSAGDPGSFDSKFLSGLANDIYDVEKGSKGDIWDINQMYNQENSPWFVNDPLDSALGMLSHHPDEATKFLDPGDKKEGTKLEYLLKERDWEGIVPEHSEWAKVETSRVEEGVPEEDTDVRKGLGSLLEAATTGRTSDSPGVELGRHSEAQARIMQDTINLIDYGNSEGKEGDPKRLGRADEILASEGYANMRDPLARAFATYSPDVVDIIAGEGPGQRVGRADEFASGDESQIQNSRSSLLRMMRGVSDVPGGSEQSENFNLIAQAQLGYMGEQLGMGDFSARDAEENRAQKVGEVFGAITAVGGDLDLDVRDQKNSEDANTRFYGYHVLGGAITGIPLIGDIAQRTVDIELNEWLSAVQAENGLLTKEKLASQNDAAHDALDKIFKNWNNERQLVGDETLGKIQNEARQSYDGSRSIVFDALRSRS